MVKGVDWQRAQDGAKPFTVYNFEVANSHTYFVGTENGGTWVHNANCDLGNLSKDEVKSQLYDKPENIGHLREFFGNKDTPPNLEAGQNLTRENLEAYRELAQRLINAGKDTGVQARRIQQINEYLSNLP